MSTSARPSSSSSPAGRLAVLASGHGSLLEAIMATDLPVAVLITDRSCRALEVARSAGLPTVLLDRREFGWPDQAWDRAGFTAALAAELSARRIDLVAMAGFMTVLSPSIFVDFADRILNTHPSLLPLFKGPGPQVMRDTLAAGVTETGCTVHIANPDLDAGRILAQGRVPVLPRDTVESLHERIKAVERRLYPQTIGAYLRDLTH